MKSHHPQNERIKHRYITFLKEAKRVSETTVDAITKAIARFEEYTKYKDFKTFRHEQAVGFKRNLLSQKSQQTGKPLSKSTVHSTLMHLKAFFQWLSREQGYKSKIAYSDAEYFNSSNKDMQVATARRTQREPSIEQIRHVINSMLADNEIDMRNRALIAFALLTGARDSAIASAKISHVNLDENCFFQDAREVDTKFSKTFNSFFFPVGYEFKQIFVDWVQYLTQTKLYGPNDPLFPKSEMAINDKQQFEAKGLKPEHWSTANPIRRIFKQAFIQAGLEYFNPHSFRNTLVTLGKTKCQTPEVFKAWSQNLGHESVLTTLYSYGEVGMQRQAEIMNQLDNTKQNQEENLKKLMQAMSQVGFQLG